MTCGNVVGGPSSYTWWGYRKPPCSGVQQVVGSQACDMRKRVHRVEQVRSPPVSSDPRRSAGRTRWDADLRVCRGWGYAIAVETNTIALDNSGVTRRLGPTETNGPFRSSTLACGLAVGRA